MTSNQNPAGAPSEPNSASTPVDATAIATPAKKSKLRKTAMIASGVVSLAGIGSTLAANISLNSGNNVEFGQGVARTTACDPDGFTINPVTSYDNDQSIWRLDRVDVTGLNLTPVGTNYGAGGYGSQADAKAAHPGEYYDTGTSSWKRTCDGIVLDFKAYTDETKYWTSTRDGYQYGSTNDISTPIAWAQWNGNRYQTNGNGAANFGFAVVFDTSDDNSGYDSNYGVGDNGTYRSTSWTSWDNMNHSDPANSSFSFGAYYYSYWRPDSASISKIAVSSMSRFPANYALDSSGGLGTS